MKEQTIFIEKKAVLQYVVERGCCNCEYKWHKKLEKIHPIFSFLINLLISSCFLKCKTQIVEAEVNGHPEGSWPVKHLVYLRHQSMWFTEATVLIHWCSKQLSGGSGERHPADKLCNVFLKILLRKVILTTCISKLVKYINNILGHLIL